MSKDRILKPLSTSFHLIFWGCYFALISLVNIYKFGWWHVFVIIVMAPLMLGISYTNRAWLRRVLFKRFTMQRMGSVIGYFLLTALAIFLLLYEFPTELSRKVLKNPKLFRAVDFGIDVFTFYMTFVLKGILILAIEIIYNFSVGLFRHLGLKRKQSLESLKAKFFRNWAVHFMGNLTQSFTRLAQKKTSALARINLFFGLEAYAMRKMNFGQSISGKLEDELFYLRQLMRLYGEHHIHLQSDIQDWSHPTIPLMLLSLYKNMVKHGDFSDSSFESIIYVFSDTERVSISCTNKVSSQSAWIFEEGGTGLEQLTKLLRLEYGEKFSLIKQMADGIFYLNLDINF
ncbi:MULTISPECIES: hypothetical protein [Sphingobacterium]|uniref:hypothetical protein n=1 Tax=Sphingobacterium TaxID=28453 RepID=UPI00257C9494|nr:MULTISPECIES: hypothetical protein [Sphingobacterium]